MAKALAFATLAIVAVAIIGCGRNEKDPAPVAPPAAPADPDPDGDGFVGGADERPLIADIPAFELAIAPTEIGIMRKVSGATDITTRHTYSVDAEYIQDIHTSDSRKYTSTDKGEFALKVAPGKENVILDLSGTAVGRSSSSERTSSTEFSEDRWTKFKDKATHFKEILDKEKASFDPWDGYVRATVAITNVGFIKAKISNIEMVIVSHDPFKPKLQDGFGSFVVGADQVVSVTTPIQRSASQPPSSSPKPFEKDLVPSQRFIQPLWVIGLNADQIQRLLRKRNGVRIALNGYQTTVNGSEYDPDSRLRQVRNKTVTVDVVDSWAKSNRFYVAAAAGQNGRVSVAEALKVIYGPGLKTRGVGPAMTIESIDGIPQPPGARWIVAAASHVSSLTEGLPAGAKVVLLSATESDVKPPEVRQLGASLPLTIPSNPGVLADPTAPGGQRQPPAAGEFYSARPCVGTVFPGDHIALAFRAHKQTSSEGRSEPSPDPYGFTEEVDAHEQVRSIKEEIMGEQESLGDYPLRLFIDNVSLSLDDLKPLGDYPYVVDPTRRASLNLVAPAYAAAAKGSQLCFAVKVGDPVTLRLGRKWGKPLVRATYGIPKAQIDQLNALHMWMNSKPVKNVSFRELQFVVIDKLEITSGR